MIRGIRFEVPNAWGNIFEILFKNLDIANHKINIINEDIYTDNNLDNNNIFIQPIQYIGNHFLELIKEQLYYVVFLEMHIFSDKREISVFKNYEEFLKTDCVFCVFFTDVKFVDIYTRDNKILDIFNYTAKENNFKRIEYITEENDVDTQTDDWLQEIHFNKYKEEP